MRGCECESHSRLTRAMTASSQSKIAAPGAQQQDRRGDSRRGILAARPHSVRTDHHQPDRRTGRDFRGRALPLLLGQAGDLRRHRRARTGCLPRRDRACVQRAPVDLLPAKVAGPRARRLRGFSGEPPALPRVVAGQPHQRVDARKPVGSRRPGRAEFWAICW